MKGSGAVRAGMWARALCFNDSLKSGAVLEYVKKARSQGYSVLILNPNLNKITKPEFEPTLEHKFAWFDPEKPSKPSRYETDAIENSSSPPEHCINAWKKFVEKSKAKDIVIVAHSAGGWFVLF